MATQNEETSPQNAATRAINEARADATMARRYLRRLMLQQGSVDAQAKVEAAEAAVALYDELKEHRSEAALEQRWEKSEIERLEDALGSTAMVPVASAGRTNNQKQKPRPAMHTVPAQDIISVIDTLCELAKTAGYGAPIETAQRDSGFQYSDILETGPPGSRDAPDIDKEGAE